MLGLHNRPWNGVAKHLRSKYRVVAEIDFLDIDYDALKLYRVLSSLKKSSYDADEKILIYHYDLEFYGNLKYGVMIYNFLQCVRSLDISPSVFVVLTSHYGLGREIQQYWITHCDQFDSVNDAMTVFESNYQQLQSPEYPQVTDLDIDKISHAFICLCGQRRVHRMMFLCGLANLDLVNKGLCSWHFDKQLRALAWKTVILGWLKFLNPRQMFDRKVPVTQYNLLSVYPKTFYNDEWPVNQYFRDCYNQYHAQFETSYQHPLIKGTTNTYRFDLPTIKNALLYVSIESVFEHPHVYFTEKTFKAIVMKRPFVIVGSVGSLAKLRELGFKTFDGFWNEDYDQELEPNQRLKKVLDITNRISQLSVADLQQMCYNMQDILEHNAVHYREHYAQQLLHERLKKL